nr:hypothetical protein PJ912_18750 [Pectobacterium colocasium]
MVDGTLWGNLRHFICCGQHRHSHSQGTLLGSIMLVAIAAVIDNCAEESHWPAYWHGIGQRKRQP